ncbi:phosphotransferase [Paenibacillus sp. FSL R7-0216]|uniref:phosphotransferase family protein n=1 Tax=Paenibacillus sp. FSL R7-0216 TaxID=2921677 RepID=UPI0030D9BB36
MNDMNDLLQGKLGDWTERIFGTGYRPEEANQMHGGAQKAVYTVRCSNGFRFVLYVWDVRMNYFREELEQKEAAEAISGYGGEPFRTVNEFMEKLQVRTPKLYHFESGATTGDADFAFVEYVDGREASDFFQADAKIQGRIFEPLADMLNRLHRQTRTYWGKLQEPLAQSASGCHLPMLAQARRELAYLAENVPVFRNRHDRFVEVIEGLAGKIQPRPTYSFIHAELGPNHVLVDRELRPWFIDIEGALFFDPEYEHSFMEFRFDNYDQYLKTGGLDPHRMAFYKLYHHISYSAAPYRLLQRGFPDAETVKEIMEFNVQSALHFI